MKQFRNFSIRLSITYIAFSVLLLLPGIEIRENLFAIWATALVFTLLSVVLRPVLLALTLPFIILSGGLFIFIVDGILLILTGFLSGLLVANIGWAMLGVIVMGIINIWVQGIYRRIGWLDAEGNIDDDEVVVITRQIKPWVRVLLFGLLIMGVLFSYDMARQIFIATGAFTPDIPVMTGVALTFWILIQFTLTWLVAEGLALNRRAIFAIVVTVIAAVPLALLVQFELFTPVTTTEVPTPDTDDVQFWEGPGGFQIGYRHIAPSERSAANLNPIVFLHGGPGFATSPQDAAFFARFAEQGYDVYLYDRLGSGASDQPADLAFYSVDQNLRTLEFIRDTLDADQLILLTHAEGSELAMHYLERHPDRIETVITIAPTPIFFDERLLYDYGRTAGFGEVTAIDLRIDVATDIAYYSPDAAGDFAPMLEINNWYNSVFDKRILVCPGDVADADSVTFGTFNLYADVRMERSFEAAGDIRPELSENTTPVVILRPICDYSPWETILQYRDTLPNTRVYIVEDAGSMAYLSQPDSVASVITSVLHGEEPPIPVYTDRVDPWTVFDNIPLPETE